MNTIQLMQQKHLILQPDQPFDVNSPTTQRSLQSLWKLAETILQGSRPYEEVGLSISAHEMAESPFFVQPTKGRRIKQRLERQVAEKGLSDRNNVQLMRIDGTTVQIAQIYYSEEPRDKDLREDTKHRDEITLQRIIEDHYAISERSEVLGDHLHYGGRRYESEPIREDTRLEPVPLTNRAINRAIYMLLKGTRITDI